MQPLEKSLRNQLERTVREARDVAEAAAKVTIQQLGISEANPYGYLSESERKLRNRLRAHARQLGDKRQDNGIQEITLLIEEVAYEHWHRMLFARFLEENNLLMYPDPENPVPITLEECEELAPEEGAKNGWELAARYAAKMFPQIFRPDSPVFELTFPLEHQQKLEKLLNDLPTEVFHASDSLGWVYQFWQSKKKDEINASEVKIGSRELPAVTQLFTESYMVSFLLDNSLGAWWAARRLSDSDLINAQNEEELRKKASLPGVPLEYLRFVKKEDGKWIPAAGTFDAWPKDLSELKILDPCCGSGHFLVAALNMLVPMRMELEGLSARDAINAVLRDNIHGLEIDKRCVELAAFNLALTAWRYPCAGGYWEIPEMNVACSGIGINATKEEWKQFAQGNHNLRIALDFLFDDFNNAPILGSLINPVRNNALKIVHWDELSPVLKEALFKEKTEEKIEMGIVAQGLVRAEKMLTGKYHLIITNVPYLTRGKQDPVLKDFCEQNYKEAKNDLAMVFLKRCLDFCFVGGNVSIVLPQNWLFLTSYRKFREKLLKNETWLLIARLGPGAFETISGEVGKAILITMSKGRSGFQPLYLEKSLEGSSTFTSIIRGLDVSQPRTAAEKAVGLITTEIKQVEQMKQLENPDAIILIDKINTSTLFSEFANCNQGIGTGDSLYYILKFWEIPLINAEWDLYQMAPKLSNFFNGTSSILRWEKGLGSLSNSSHARICGQPSWGKIGIGVAVTNNLNRCIYLGHKFDCTLGVITSKNINNIQEINTFSLSENFVKEVKKVDPSLSVTERSFLKVPFDLDFWTKVANDKYPNGLPHPFSNDPTQWIFHGHPCGSVVWDEVKKWTVIGPLRTDATVLQVAVARLLGYRWPAEMDNKMELSDETRFWVKQTETLLPYADQDGIVCIPPVRGEISATERLLKLLAAAYDKEWSHDILSELLKQADHEGKSLESWLRDKFFIQHCKLFHHRPFIWHIWDGLPDGFTALVNYHKLDRKNLEILMYTYLGDWMKHQKDEIHLGVDGAQERLAAAENLKKRLELILEGEAPYDIFIRWKPIEKQPIGWEPDLNDGVRLNIRPFMTVPDVGKKGAGVLRDKPNIDWRKDRGKDVESAPWYHLFKGDRINDYHLSLAEKQNTWEMNRKETK